MVRTILFWLHLTAALFAGVVVFIMSVTGVMLTYEKQMLLWADRRAAGIEVPGADTPRASIDTIVERVGAAAPDAAITSITRRHEPESPVMVTLTSGATLMVNPYSGAVIGEAPRGLRNTFRTVTQWHRYLSGNGEYRAAGKVVTGACNLAFLFIVLSGIYLWFPRRWTRAAVAAVTVPTGTTRLDSGRPCRWPSWSRPRR
jgi:uncharacterized iron-regulated membrane protein